MGWTVKGLFGFAAFCKTRFQKAQNAAKTRHFKHFPTKISCIPKRGQNAVQTQGLERANPNVSYRNIFLKTQRLAKRCESKQALKYNSVGGLHTPPVL